MFRKVIAFLMIVLMAISIIPLNTLTVFAAENITVDSPAQENSSASEDETIDDEESGLVDPTVSPSLAIVGSGVATEYIAPVGEGELAESGTCGDNITWQFNRTTGKLVLNGTGPMPSYNNNSSWNVFHSPFNHSTAIKSVTINEGITTVGSYSFTYCSELSSVSIPDSVTSIGAGAFNYSGITYFNSGKNVEHLGGDAFYDCKKLTEVVLNEGLKKIGNSAFHACDSLKRVTIPSTLEEIANGAFSPKIERVDIKSVEAWCRIKFIDRQNWENTSNPLHRGAALYLNGMLLTDLTIPNTITSINYIAFIGCTSIKNLVIPDSVQKIGGKAFANCSGLETIRIGSGIKSIDSSAFYNCGSLTSIRLDAKNVIVNSDVFNNNHNLSDITGNGSFGELYEHAFNNCEKLKSSSTLDGVLMKAKGVFSGCQSLTRIVLNDKTETINDTAFYNCSSLKEVVMPDSVKVIEIKAFHGNKSLAHIDLPSSLKTICKEAFMYCSSLTDITIPSGVTEIQEGAFSGCNNLTSFIDYADPPRIGRGLFGSRNSNLVVFCEPVGNTAEYMAANGINYKDIDWVYQGKITVKTGNDFNEYVVNLKPFSGSSLSRTVRNGEAVFSRINPKEQYTVTLQNAKGRILGTQKVSFGEGVTNITVDFRTDKMYQHTVQVVDEKDKPVSDYTVAWYVNGSDNVDSDDNTVRDLKSGDTVKCVVKIGESMVEDYEQPSPVSLTVTRTNTTKIVVKKAKKYPFTVTVLTSDGKPYENGDVSIIQQLSDVQNDSKSYHTDKNGKVRTELRAVSTSVRASGAFLLPDTWNGVPDATHASAELTLKPNEGLKLIPRFEYHFTDETQTNIYKRPDVDALQYEIFNKTKNVPVTTFSVEKSVITIPFSAVNNNDLLEITVKDQDHYFAESTAQVKYTNDTETFTVDLRENGMINISDLSSGGSPMALIFGEDGKFAASQSFYYNCLTVHLKEGKYTVVLMAYQPMLYRIASYDDFLSYGLTPDKDYRVKTVSVKPLETAQISAAIPTSKNSIGLYLDPNETYLRLNPSIVRVGTFNSIVLNYKIDDKYIDRFSPERIELTVSSGMVLHSVVMVDNVKSQNAVIKERSMTVPATDFSGKISTSAKCTDINESYSVTAKLIGRYNGEEIAQPIGTEIVAPKSEYEVPSLTVDGHVDITGSVEANAQVSVFLDGVRYTEVKSSKTGVFHALIIIESAYNLSYHSIYFEILSDNFIYRSPNYLVEYNRGRTAVESIYMSPNGMYGGRVKLYGSDGQYSTSYYYWPGKYDKITYTVDFVGNVDSLRNVSLVSVSSRGERVNIPMTRVGNTNSFSGTYEYTRTGFPAELGVVYDEDYPRVTGSSADLKQASADLESSINEYNKAIEEYNKWLATASPSDAAKAEALLSELRDVSKQVKMPFEVKESSDGRKTIKDLKSGTTISIRQWKDNSLRRDGLISKGYTEISSSGNGASFFLLETDDRAVCVNLTTKDCFEISMYSPAVPTGNSDIAPTGFGWGSFSGISTFTGMCDTINSFTQGFAEIGSKAAKAIGETAHSANLGSVANVADSFGKVTGTASTVIGAVETGKALGDSLDYRNRLNKLKAERDRLEQAMSSRECSTDLSILGNISSDLSKGENNLHHQYFYTGYKAATTVVSGVSLFTPMGPLTSIGITAATTFTDSLVDSLDIQGQMEERLSDIESEMDAAISYLNDNKCDPDDEDYSRENFKSPSPSRGTKGKVDPSGFVCEAVESNRLEGVTATIYYSPNEDGSDAVIWDAEEYDQMNPLQTDSMGKYEWFVPEGYWQVKYEKPGYVTTYSEWLPVPPPQLEVNVAMNSTEAPYVESCIAYTDSIEFLFSHYMKPTSFDNGEITVIVNGKTVNGTLTPVNAEQGFANNKQIFASRFRYNLDKEIEPGDTVKVRISGGRDYAGNGMNVAYSSDLRAEVRVDSLTVKEEQTVYYGKPVTLSALTLSDGGAVSGKKIIITVDNTTIVSCDKTSVVTDSNGSATFTLRALLPGETFISYRVEGTDVTGTTVVKTSLDEPPKQVGKVAASIPSGRTFVKGTKFALTCSDPQAKIYYTLDLSCPCQANNPARKLYTKPITLNSNMTLIAYAVRDGYLDSVTTLFTFTVGKSCNVLLGDADGDDSINIMDSTRIQRNLAELSNMNGTSFDGSPLSDYEMSVCDTDNDGYITIMDATAIQRYVAELKTNQNIGKPIG